MKQFSFFSKKNIIEAEFLSRPNRFIVLCKYKDKKIKAYLENSGRLLEILLPYKKVYLIKHKEYFKVIAGEKEDFPVILDTHFANLIVRQIKEEIPYFRKAKIIGSEVKLGRSRFDFLLRKKDKLIILEVKTCTLFGREVAMFPDAKTERTKKHIQDLVSVSCKEKEGAILFLVHSFLPSIFLPNYHVDLDFSLALLEAKDKIKIFALGLLWNKDFSLSKVKILKIPWIILKKEAKDSGSYLLILELKRRRKIKVGNLGRLTFPKGFYIYVGKAKNNLLKRVLRHKRKTKQKHWHIDFLREFADFKDYFLVRSSIDLECKIAQSLFRISDWVIKDFGSSDCSCESHLFGFKENPLYNGDFQKILVYFYLDRLGKVLRQERSQIC